MNAELNLEIEATKSITPHAFTMSSVTLDTMLNKILEADLDNVIEIPTRLPANLNYGSGLVRNYRPVDVAWIKNQVEDGFTGIELEALNVLACWTYRNTGDLVRSAVGLIGSVLHDRCIVDRIHDIENSDMTDNAYAAFISETPWTIRRLIKTATTGGAIEGKIPVRNYSEIFAELGGVRGTTGETDERERMARLMSSVSATSNISEANMSQKDFAASRLIQLTKSVCLYKRDDSFGRLRSFLTNGSMLATLVRIKCGNNDHLARLSYDILDMAHSIDRMLNSNCMAANSLLNRMLDGELVYDEILAMGRHQHRIMALEYTSMTTLFAYFLKQVDLSFKDDADVGKAISRLVRFSGIIEQYANEVISKQFNDQ